VEDLVAVAVRLESGEVRHFITYGRIQDSVDPGPLAQLVLEQTHRFSLGGKAVAAEVCDTLQHAKDEPYFYEALFAFSQDRIPYGPRYENWRRRIDAEMRDGRHLHFLGRPLTPPS
jgi:hypothetical protein